MFKSIKNAGNANKIWKLLNEKYFDKLGGRIGNTVLKIESNEGGIDYLLVHTESSDVSSILRENEQQIIQTLRNEYEITISGIRLV